MRASPVAGLFLVAAALSGVSRAASLPVVLIDPLTEAEVTLEPGRPTHLVFLATWCPDCLEELPRLTELHDRWSGRGYRLFLVAVPTRQDAARLRAFATERDLPGRLLWDRDGGVTRSLGVDGLPTHILLGRSGEEIGRWTAADDSLVQAVERAVEEARR